VKTIITETMVLPTGCTTEYPNWYLYALFVRWQDTLGWTVTTNFIDNRLSVKGRKWTTFVEKRNRRFYYFPTYEEALAAAREEVDNLRVMGKTYKESKGNHHGA